MKCEFFKILLGYTNKFKSVYLNLQIDVMLDAAIILDYLRKNKVRFFQKYQLTQIGIFGSIARGEQTENSDIDIIIEFEPNTSDLYSLKLNLRNEIQSKFNRPVDICRLKYIKPIFRSQIESEIRYVE